MTADPATSALRWLEANQQNLPIGLAVAAGIVAVMLVLRWVGGAMAARDPQCLSWKGVFGRVLLKTSIAFMVVTAIDIVLTYAAAPPRISRVVDIAFIVVAALQVAVWARELVLGMVSHRVREDTESTLGNATAIIRVLASVALFAVAFIVILDNLGVNVTALIAGLGIGGIAIGLAAQGIFSDLFAALSILFDKPFRRGDTVRYGTTTATVERIGLKTTRLRAVTGEQVIMANTKLLDQELHNLAEAKVRRVTLPLSLTYQVSPDAIAGLPDLLGPVVNAHKGCRLVRAVAIGFGPSAIDVEMLYDDRTIDPDKLAAHKSAIIIGVLRALAEQGIAFAYPTQTTFTAAPDGTLVMPWAPDAASKS